MQRVIACLAVHDLQQCRTQLLVQLNESLFILLAESLALRLAGLARAGFAVQGEEQRFDGITGLPLRPGRR